MLIEQAYNAGKKIRKAILEKNGDINTTVHKLQNTKHNIHDLSYEYLKICLDYNIANDNKFMVQMLADDVEEITSHNVAISLCMGIMSEDEYISFLEASKRWGKDRTTIQKAKDSGKFNQNDWKKEGRNLYIKVSAMERIYGKEKNE